MEKFDGIVFRGGPTGRRAALVGGPDVWELMFTLKSSKARGEAAITATAEFLNLTDFQVRTAVRYYGTFPDEIDRRTPSPPPMPMKPRRPGPDGIAQWARDRSGHSNLIFFFRSLRRDQETSSSRCRRPTTMPGDTPSALANWRTASAENDPVI